MRAVVVDDDPIVLELLKRILEGMGFEVEAYENPTASRLYHDKKCTRSDPCCDLLLTDYEMPVLNGVQFIRHLQCKGCKINKIAIVSGIPSEVIKEKEENIEIKIIYKPEIFAELKKWAK